MKANRRGGSVLPSLDFELFANFYLEDVTVPESYLKCENNLFICLHFFILLSKFSLASATAQLSIIIILWYYLSSKQE